MILAVLIFACAGDCSTYRPVPNRAFTTMALCVETAQQVGVREENDGYERRGVGIYNMRNLNFPIHQRTIYPLCFQANP